MTDTKPRTLASVLIRHQYDVVIEPAITPGCTCGWHAEDEWASTEVYEAHLVDVIADHLRAHATDPDVIATIKRRLWGELGGGEAVIEATCKAFVETLGGGES